MIGGRTLAFQLVILCGIGFSFLLPSTCSAQADGQQPSSPQPPQQTLPTSIIAPTPVVVTSPPPPKTHLQEMAEHKGSLVVCGFTDIGALQRDDGGYVRITAAQFTDTAAQQTAWGVLLFIHQPDAANREVRTFIDDDELDNLLSSLDSLGRLDHGATALNNFDANIRTRGDLDIANIDAGGARELAFHGVEFVSTSGEETWAAVRFPLARVAELQQYLTTAKQTLDKAKQAKPAP